MLVPSPGNYSRGSQQLPVTLQPAGLSGGPLTTTAAKLLVLNQTVALGCDKTACTPRTTEVPWKTLSITRAGEAHTNVRLQGESKRGHGKVGGWPTLRRDG
mmetsp:Transcript_96087/g.256778  ORF Transcript_96087/g.256778 Transcript_96087/m.256778 type:complete len:101 (-) Transcript_96087:11-313(-)